MNRGVNGIDGVVSTAIGAALVNKKSTFAFLGDIATIHDLNSFVIPKLEKIPDITFIICDNNGGGIFNTLEQADVEDFERVYGTPTNIDLVNVIKNLDIDAKYINELKDLEKELNETKGIKVLVVKVTSRVNEADLRKNLLSIS